MIDDIDPEEEERWYQETMEANHRFAMAKDKTISFFKLVGQLAVLAILTGGTILVIVLGAEKVFK